MGRKRRKELMERSATAKRRRLKEASVQTLEDEDNAQELLATTGEPAREFVIHPLIRPNSQIRLLKILPGERNDVVSLKVFTYDRVDAPSYRAISYTWGDDKDKQQLLLDDQPFRVNHNCYYTLWQTRLHFPSSFVWIDSICINQQDNQEKGMQIPLMGEIYSAASQVLACIGEHNDDSQRFAYFARKTDGTIHALFEPGRPSWLPELPEWMEWWWREIQPAYVRHLYQHYGTFPAAYFALVFVCQTVISRCKKWIAPKLSTRWKYIAGLRRPFDTIARRPYWRRLWIVQEIVKARHLIIQCGEDVIEWEDILLVKKMLGDVGKLPASAFAFSALEDTIMYGALDVTKLLTRFSHLGCRDPRDRLFGLLGLLQFSLKKDRDDNGELIPGRKTHGAFERRDHGGPLNASFADYSISAFGWVLRLVCHINLALTPKLLVAFGVNASTPELKSIVRKRQEGRWIRKARHRDSDENSYGKYWHKPFLDTGFCRIGLDNDDNLTADFALKVPTSSKHSVSHNHMQDTEPVLAHLPGTIWRSRIPKGSPRKIMVDGCLAAVVCSNAQVDDFLLAIKPSEDGQIFLVLRPNPSPFDRFLDQPSFFNVIGQGFTLGGYELKFSKFGYTNYRDIEKHTSLKSGCCSARLHVSPEDAIYLVGHDFINEDTFDARARVERLHTFPVEVGIDAVSVFTTWCLDGKCIEQNGNCSTTSSQDHVTSAGVLKP